MVCNGRHHEKYGFRTKPRQKLYSLNGVAQGYLPRRGYRGVGDINTSHSSLWFLVSSSLRFEKSSSWTSNTEFDSAMVSFPPRIVLVLSSKMLKGWTLPLGI